MSAQIENLKQASNAIYLQVASLYAIVCLCVYFFAALESGFNLVFLGSSALAWMLIGWCQFALFNALHEGLHNRFGNPHQEFLAYASTAYTVGFDERYRKVHLDHHKYFGDPEMDPDYPNYGNFPRTKRAFLGRLFLNLCGWLALLQFLGVRQTSTASGEVDAREPSGALFRVAVTQLIILALFWLTLGWFYYLWLWIIPIVTFGKFFSSTRAFCEHGSPDDRPTIRTITGSFLGEKVLGVFCFHYHAEHHRYVAIPCNRLAEVNIQFAESVYSEGAPGEPHYEHYRKGYGSLLLAWFRELPF
ncbi:MAG: fatty acid desaturase [Halioglobus sp.]|jgi:fatty acid desaturase